MPWLVTISGPPDRTLARYARLDDDLLVVGSSPRGPIRRLISGSVSRYCFSHTACPVLVVPADAFARAVARDGAARTIDRDLMLLTG